MTMEVLSPATVKAPLALTVATPSYKDAVQVISNSEFSDASGWTLSGGWAISGGKLTNATGAVGNISIPLTGLTAGVAYVIEFGVTAGGVYFFPSADSGTTDQGYWRYWESVNHIGFVPPSSSCTLTLKQNYVTAGAEIDYIRMYKVVPNADRILQGSSSTSAVPFGLVPSNTSFGLGQNSLYSAAKAVDSVAIGYSALRLGIRPYESVAIGSYSLELSTSPQSCVAIGVRALRNVNSGAGNIGIGADAGFSITSGGSNIAVGSSSLQSVTTGEGNTALGQRSLVSVVTGFQNVAVGEEVALNLNAGSAYNTLVGARVLRTAAADAYNFMTALGANAFNNIPYSSSMCLGHSSAVTGTNQNQIGASGTTTYCYGAVQDRSDARDKREVRDTVLGLDFVMGLRPVDFKWDMREDYRTEPPAELASRQSDLQRLIADLRAVEPEPAVEIAAAEVALEAVDAQLAAHADSNRLANITTDGSKVRRRFHHGFIAQEVRERIDASGLDFGGFQDHSLAGGDDVLSLGYIEFIAPLVKAVQQQQALILSLQARLDAADL